MQPEVREHVANPARDPDARLHSTNAKREATMPEKKVIRRARRDARQGKSPSTQAGEFVREEIRRIRKGRHGARNAKQAIAIGLSEARRAGVKLPPPARGKASSQVRRKARQDLKHARDHKPTSAKRSRARVKALRKESTSAASHRSLSRQARSAAQKRGHANRSKAARKAAKTRRKRNR